MSKDKLSLKEILKDASASNEPLSEKERDILNAANLLFSHGGFDGISTAEIAKQAQVTERTLFKYFPTKQTLYRRILFPLILMGMPLQSKIISRITDVDYATLKDFLKALYFNRYEEISRHGANLSILVTEVFNNESFRKEFGEKLGEQLDLTVKPALKRLQEQGKVRTDIPDETIVRMILGSIMSYVMYRNILNPKGKIDDEQEINRIVQVLSDGLKKRD